MGQYDDRPYEVGKGKPPKNTQFKPGHSGNPRGPKEKRKAVEATLPVLMHEAVNELVLVTIGGKQRSIPKKQAIVLAMVNDALQATPHQRLKAFKALQEFGAFELVVEDSRLTDEERNAALQDMVKMFAEEGKREFENSFYPTNYG